MKLINKFFSELKKEYVNGSASKKLNIISNIFTILGISFVLFFSKIILDKIASREFFWGGFFLFLALFFLVLGIFIFITFFVSMLYKEFSEGRWFGFLIYLSLLFVIWLFFLFLLFSIGIAAFNFMVFSPHFRL